MQNNPWKSREATIKLADLLLAMKTSPSANNAYTLINELRNNLKDMTLEDVENVETEINKVNTGKSEGQRRKEAKIKGKL